MARFNYFLSAMSEGKRKLPRRSGIIAAEIGGVGFGSPAEQRPRRWRRCCVRLKRPADDRSDGRGPSGLTGALRVMVAIKPVDFRNYAECTIMLSPRRLAEYPRCSAIAYPKQVGSLLGIILGPSAVPWWRRREDRDVEAERRVTTKWPMYGSRRTGDVCGSVHQSGEDPWAHATDSDRLRSRGPSLC